MNVKGGIAPKRNICSSPQQCFGVLVFRNRNSAVLARSHPITDIIGRHFAQELVKDAKRKPNIGLTLVRFPETGPK